MILDNGLVFSNPQTLTVTAASTNVIDLVNANEFGVGDGDGNLKIAAYTGSVAFSGGTSLNIQFQGAPDNGSGAPGTYTTYVETGAILTAVLLPNLKIFAVDWPHRAIGAAIPRFIRLNYVIVGTYTAGSIAFAGIALQQEAAPSYPNNYTVA